MTAYPWIRNLSLYVYSSTPSSPWFNITDPVPKQFRVTVLFAVVSIELTTFYILEHSSKTSLIGDSWPFREPWQVSLRTKKEYTENSDNISK